MRYKIVLSYIGTNYSGWQSQKNSRSIQDEVEKALLGVFQTPVRLHAAGRTDVGVHAQGQTAHFDSEKSLKPFSVTQAANLLLPKDISILSCEHVKPTFDARRDVKDKIYVYRLYVSAQRNAVWDTNHAQIYKMPNVEIMRKVAEKLVGEHDFTAFCSTGSSADSTVKTVDSVTVTQPTENEIFITVKGRSFLYNMVRIIAGTLVEIGLEKLPEDTIEIMLETKVRKLGGKTYPAAGLTLEEVNY